MSYKIPTERCHSRLETRLDRSLRVTAPKACQSHVAAAPLQLLPNNTEKRHLGQYRKRKSFAGFSNSHHVASCQWQRIATVDSEIYRILRFTRLDFDCGIVCHND